MENKKGQNVSGLLPFVTAIAAVALVGGIIGLVLAQTSDSVVNSATVNVNESAKVASAIGNGS